MNFESKYWHLIKFNLAKRLSKDEMIYLCNSMGMKHFKRSDKVKLESREVSNDIYFLKKGTIKIVSLFSNGDELVKDIIKKGDIFGIMGLLGVRNEDDFAVAMEDSIICIIDSSYFKKMMEENRNLNNFIFKLAGDRIKKLERNLSSLIYKDAKSRIEDFIIDYVEDFGVEVVDFFVAKNLISNSDIGKLTSTSRQTVNKTMNDLKRNNIIDFDKNIIRVNKNILKVR
jgi:CRP/FNR family transcriptional regulator